MLVIADTTKSLLGYFVNHFSLTVDYTNNRMIGTTIKQSDTKPTPEIMNIIVNKNKAADMTVWRIIEKYPDIISPYQNFYAEKLNVFYKIKTSSNPATLFKSQQLLAKKIGITKEEFRKLQEAGIIFFSKLEWG